MFIKYQDKERSITYQRQKHIFNIIATIFLGSGLAVLSGPWWTPIVFALFDISNIPNTDEYGFGIGLIFTTIGLTVFGIKYFVIDKRNKQMKKDKATLATHLPDPDLIQHYLDNLWEGHSYYTSESETFRHAFTIFRKPQNAFQNPKSIRLFNEFSGQAQTLNSFTLTNFFVFPENQSIDMDLRFCMQPKWNIERDMHAWDEEKSRKYRALEEELQNHINEVEESFQKFLKIFDKIAFH